MTRKKVFFSKKIYVSIYNSFRDRGGGGKGCLPPPRSGKGQILARSLRVKSHIIELIYNVYNLIQTSELD